MVGERWNAAAGILSQRGILACLGLLLLGFSNSAAAASRTRSQTLAAAALLGQPTITILPSATGAPLQSYAAGSASLSFGQAAYYTGHGPPGVITQKKKGAMTLTTRFAIRVDCNGSPSPLAEVAFSLYAVDPSLTVSVDGLKLTTAPSAKILQCGSLSEHQVVVEIPITRPAGPINSAVSITAKAKN